MKKVVKNGFLLGITTIVFSSSMQAQLYGPDPLIKSRNLISEDEIILGWTEQGGSPDMHTWNAQVYNYDGSTTLQASGTPQSMTDKFDGDVNTSMFQGGAYDFGGTDIVSGNLFTSMPAKQSIITSWRGLDVNDHPRALFSIKSEQDFSGCDNSSTPSGQGPPISPSPFLSFTAPIAQIKVTTGNIMGDSLQNSENGTDEIILAYQASTGKINIHLYEPSTICSDLGASQTTALPYATEEDMIEGPSFYNKFDSHVMDITAGDIDHDGFDEVALSVIYPNQQLWIHVYEYNHNSGQLEEKYNRMVLDPELEFCCEGGCCDSGADIEKVNVKIISGEYVYQFPGEEMLVGVVYPSNSGSGADGISLIPVRENENENGLIIDFCHNCEESCASRDCNGGDLIIFQDNGSDTQDAVERFDIASGDLDGATGDGLFEEEIVMAFRGNVKVFDFNIINTTPHDKMELVLKNSFNTDNPQNDLNQDVSGRYAHSFLDVGNIQNINSTSVNNEFTAEIVVASNFTVFDEPFISNDVIEQKFTVRAYSFPTVSGIRDITAPPVEISKIEDAHKITTVRDIRQYSLGLANIDGGGISIGNAVRRDVQDIVTPIVVINAPPTHFDVFDDDTLDINNLYNAGNLPAPGDAQKTRTEYSETSATLTEFSAVVTNDWAQSRSISAGFEGFGVSLGASMTNTYGEQFSASSSSSRQITFEMTSTIINSDRVIAYVVDYDVYEYPVYLNDNTNQLLTHMVVVVPDYPNNTVEIDASGYDHDYQIEHQHGNLFSYPYDLDDIQNLGSEFYELTTQTINNPFSGSTSGATIGEATSSGMSETQSTMNSFEGSAGFSYQGLSIGGSVSGSYSTEDLTTRSTTISNTKELKAFFSPIETGLNTLQYQVTPILFWDVDGALNIDFTTDIDNTSNQLWHQYYNEIDPAFLLPDLHTPEKGIEVLNFESQRYKTKDIKMYPTPISGAGSAVQLFARVHNYGMLSTDVNTGIPVCFYYNTDGNEALQLIACDTLDTALIGRADDFASEVAEIEWDLPMSLTSNDNPKVVAIIDPDDIHPNEVHDYPSPNGFSNNIGWACLFTSDCGAITDDSVLFLNSDPCANLSAILTLDGDPIASGTYYANDKIILNGHINGTAVNAIAPNGVEMLPEFNISNSGVLEAAPGDCANE